MTNQEKSSRRRVFRVSPSMVVALVALTAAIGGGVAVAAPAGKTQHKTKAVAASNRGQRGFRGYRGYRGAAGSRGSSGSAGVVPAIITVDSPVETLNPGDTTFDVDPNNFQATCPSGYSVLGTAFNGSIGQTAFVISYGTFVGGFMNNNSSISIQVYIQAICGVVPAGSSGANARGIPSAANARYQTMLKSASAASSGR